MKKTTISLCLLIFMLACAAPVRASEAAALVEDIPTVQAYTKETVPEDDIIRIVQAGINAPSGMNSQPWHFSVVTDPAVLEEIASGGDMSSSTRAGVTDAPMAIVISCREGAGFDAALATQTMSVEAQLLGYGSKIFVYPTVTLNGERQEEFREMLAIPENMLAAAILVVGKEDRETDAVSGPTGRNPIEEMVSYIVPEKE